MFDLKNDAHELKNLADDTKFASTKKELLSEFVNWRETVIQDQGVSELFRAASTYPKENPMTTAGEWAKVNAEKYDFKVTGWPAWYPTRNLEEWKQVRSQRERYVFRKTEDEAARPIIPYVGREEKGHKTRQESLAAQSGYVG